MLSKQAVSFDDPLAPRQRRPQVRRKRDELDDGKCDCQAGNDEKRFRRPRQMQGILGEQTPTDDPDC